VAFTSLPPITIVLWMSLIKAGCSLNYLQSACSPEPWPSWVPDLSQSIYSISPEQYFDVLIDQNSSHELQGRKLRVRCAKKVEKIVRILTKYPECGTNRLRDIMIWTSVRSRRPKSIIFREDDRLDIARHLNFLEQLRKFLAEVADIWTDCQFQDLGHFEGCQKLSSVSQSLIRQLWLPISHWIPKMDL